MSIRWWIVIGVLLFVPEVLYLLWRVLIVFAGAVIEEVRSEREQRRDHSAERKGGNSQ